jgi:hypothetical protein
MAEIVPVVHHNGSQVEDIHDDKQKHFESEHVENGVEQVKHEILVEDANKAEHFEHDMTTWQAFKIYKAVCLCCPSFCYTDGSGSLLVHRGILLDHHGGLRLGSARQPVGYDRVPKGESCAH